MSTGLCFLWNKNKWFKERASTELCAREAAVLTFPLITKHRSASLLLQPNPFIDEPVRYSRPAVRNILGELFVLTQSPK